MILLHNGRVQTQDPACPEAQAVLIDGQRILRVGSDRGLLPLLGDADEAIDLQGRLVLPGFTDTHFHLYDWALDYGSVDLAKVTSLDEMQAAVAEKAAHTPPDHWILGYGFNEADWPQQRLPDRHDLDRAAPHHPLCLWRCDLHVGVVNSRALELAGISETTPEPAEGRIEKQADGRPSGVLREMALNLIRDVLPEKSAEQIQANLRACIQELHALGITGIHDVRLMGGLHGTEALQHFQMLRQRDQLDLRCHVSLPGERTEEVVALGLRTGFGDDKLRIGALKFFADGGMGARTGWLIEPYLDAEYGMPLTPIADIREAVRLADPAGLSVMIHGIGDRANRELISMFEELAPLTAPLPHRIEHLQMVRPEDLDRMARIGQLAASCQPNNLSLDVSMIDLCVAERGRFTYPLRSILERGIPLMLSSDAPVCDPAPLAGIYSAVTRKRMNRTPAEGWYPEQRLSVAEAIRGYTLTPAEVTGVAGDLGSLAAGKFADLIVLDRDLYAVDPDEIADLQVDMTFFDGRLVYQRCS